MMDKSDETNMLFEKIPQTLQFQNELYVLKEEFYKESMDTPASLQQELLITDILREDLYSIADCLDNYIDNDKLVIPSTNVINLFAENGKKITDDVIKYSRQKQLLVKQFMNDVCEILDAYKEIDGFLKKYYVNQIFRIHIFNLE